jgi:ankyrin repeat protein
VTMRATQIVASMAIAFLCLAGTSIAAGKSDVADAVQKRDKAGLKTLLTQKADVNATQVDGATALHWAVYWDDVETAGMLIKAGAKPDVANREGATPLQMASLFGSTKMVDLLLTAGANAKQVAPNGETMVMFAARNGNPEIIKLLVKGGADVNARERLRLTTALMWAAEQRHPEAVKALIELGANVAAKSGPAGLPRNYMANRVNVTTVKTAAERYKRAVAAGRTYEEQLAIEQKEGRDLGGQRGLATPLGPDGNPLPPDQAARDRASLERARQAANAGAPDATRNSAGGGAPEAVTQPGTQPTAQPAAQPAGGGGRAQGAGAATGQNAQGARQGGARQGGAGASPEIAAAAAAAGLDPDDLEVIVAGLVGTGGGGLTPLIFASREGDVESAKALLDAGADVNQTSEYGWTPLLTAVNNRHWKLAQALIERGADTNIANKGGWTPLYLATDIRNIEGGDYPVARPDMDSLEFIKFLLDHKADPNARIKDNTLTRTIFTMQWFFEDGATAFVRAAQSSDTALMKLLLDYKADPKIATNYGDTALTVAAGIGWVEGVTYERSAKDNFEAVKLLLDVGIDPNAANRDGRTPLMGAALKGRSDVIQLLVDRGAKVDQRDNGSRDTDKVGSTLAGHTWQAVDYADGLVRVGVQSAVARPEAGALLRKLMTERGMPVPPPNRVVDSICVVELCKERTPDQ